MNVSVIIPVFNNASILEELKNKILLLSSQYKEIIIIDDCSQDTTYEELENYIKNQHLTNVELLHNKQNRGPSYSRNIGIKKAKGEYIAFLDSDDDWHPQKIMLQISLMQKLDIQISGTNHKVISPKDLEMEKAVDYQNIKPLPYKEISWPTILFKSPFATPSVVMHHSLKNYLFDEDMKYSEDYNLWKRITYKHKAIKILLPLTYTFKHDYLSDASSLSTNLKQMQLGVEKSFQSLLKNSEIVILDKLLIIIALWFSKIKYLRRILKRYIK